MPYTPTEWGNKNPKLTPELMNHLENGIAELESSTNASVTELTEENTRQNDKITTLNSNLTDIQSALDGKAASSHTHTKSQITDFPTSMPANGGNSTTVNGHTVKSDVPESAVFTDTVYDDSEVKESIDDLNSNLTDIQSALDGKAASSHTHTKSQITDFPTSMPANGGNSTTVNGHTVKSDVPESAVFTDTVYDDSEVKESIDDLNSNLDELEFGEVAGGKNLFKDYDVMQSYTISSETYNGYPVIYSNDVWMGAFQSDLILKSGVTYTISAYIKGNGRAYLFSTLQNYMMYIDLTDNFERFSFVYTPNEDIKNIRIENETDGGLYIACFQIEKGDTVTPYEPYIPSVKMLAEENAHQSTEAIDLKMLGWTVPKECPIQNYIDNDGVFHQRVGRVDLGNQYYSYNGNDNLFYFSKITDAKPLGQCVYQKFNGVTGSSFEKDWGIVLNETSYNVTYINAPGYTDPATLKHDLTGVYLYYELAEEILIKVDGNEAVTKVNESLGVLGKCKNLLKPTLQTTTLNGVTCTANGDGTYTLNGTASSQTTFVFTALKASNLFKNGITYKICGCPKLNNNIWLMIENQRSPYTLYATDYGNGGTFTYTLNDKTINIFVRMNEGIVLNNVVLKPMITTNLNAIYDDFVPYTGDGETLTHDVAELKNDLSRVKKSVGEVIASPSLNDLITGIDLKNTSGHVTKAHIDFLNVGGQKIVLQGSVSGAAGDFFSVSKNDNVGFDLKVDNTFVVPEPVTKLLYSSQGDFRSTVVGTITITHGTWSDGTKSISVKIVFNNNYNFTSAAVMSGIVYFDF